MCVIVVDMVVCIIWLCFDVSICHDNGVVMPYTNEVSYSGAGGCGIFGVIMVNSVSERTPF